MRDLTFLPESVQSSAIHPNGGREVMWPIDEVETAIEALAVAQKVILGLDLRSDGSDLPQETTEYLATEIPWNSFDPSNSADPVEDGRRAALESLRHPEIGDLVAVGYSWVLITWADEDKWSVPRNST